MREYSGNIFCSKPDVSGIPSSPVKRNHVGDSASMIYGLDSMTQKAFHRKYCQNIQPRLLGAQPPKWVEKVSGGWKLVLYWLQPIGDGEGK